MASLDLLLESLNKEDKKTRRVPNRTISGDTLDSIKNHRRNNYRPPPRPVDGAEGAPQRTNMSRRGARRPSKAGGGSALTTFVENMNESSRGFAEADAADMDLEEEVTVDSRQLTADKMPQLKASARRGAPMEQAIIEEEGAAAIRKPESDSDESEESEEQSEESSEEEEEEEEEESSEEESESESSEEDSDED